MGTNASPSIVKYLYDGDNVLADYAANNALTAFYVTPGLDQNLSVTDASGQTAYYTQDGLGSVRTLTAASGAILNRYDYTAFGEPFAPNTSTTIPNRYAYTAREQSPLAAHGAPMYYRWRNYAPSAGRFMWRDPIGYEGGVNVYGYAGNNPVIYFDLSGLKEVYLTISGVLNGTPHNPHDNSLNVEPIIGHNTVDGVYGSAVDSKLKMLRNAVNGLDEEAKKLGPAIAETILNEISQCDTNVNIIAHSQGANIAMHALKDVCNLSNCSKKCCNNKNKIRTILVAPKMRRRIIKYVWNQCFNINSNEGCNFSVSILWVRGKQDKVPSNSIFPRDLIIRNRFPPGINSRSCKTIKMP